MALVLDREVEVAFAPPPPSVSTAPLPLNLTGLVKRFGDRTILDGVSLGVPAGQAAALIGANGAGKSTLLRTALRLIEPDGGKVSVLGQNPLELRGRDLRHLRRRVGFVFQRHNLVPRLSVLTNVIHGAQGRIGWRAWSHAWAPDAQRQEALECLASVGLADLAGRRADRLSGGQSQRVAIARALMQRPDLMFADEPVASLDPAAGEEVMALFARLCRDRGLTLVFTTHDLTHATRYADRVVGLRGGRLAIDAPASSLGATALRGFYD